MYNEMYTVSATLQIYAINVFIYTFKGNIENVD